MRLVIDIDPDLHRAVKVKAAQEGMSVTAVIRQMLQGWTGWSPIQSLDRMVIQSVETPLLDRTPPSQAVHHTAGPVVRDLVEDYVVPDEVPRPTNTVSAVSNTVSTSSVAMTASVVKSLSKAAQVKGRMGR